MNVWLSIVHRVVDKMCRYSTCDELLHCEKSRIQKMDDIQMRGTCSINSYLWQWALKSNNMSLISVHRQSSLPHLNKLNLNFLTKIATTKPSAERWCIYHMCVSRISLIIWFARVNACKKENSRKNESLKSMGNPWEIYLEHVTGFLSSNRNVIGFV